MKSLQDLAKKDQVWRKMAYQICKDKELADDLVQEMYIKLSENKNTLNDGYVYCTLRSLFYDSLKEKNIYLDDININVIDEPVEQTEQVDYSALIKSLTWYERTMFELSTLVGQRELSRQTGIHLQTIHRVNKMVKTKLNGKKKK